MEKFKVNPSQISAKLDEGTIILKLDAGEYYSLKNSVGSLIWNMLEENAVTLDELTNSVTDQFEIDAETCRNDIRRVIDELLNYHLIETIH